MNATESKMTNQDDNIRAYLMNFEHLPYGVGVVKNDPYSTLIQANSAYYTLIGHTKEDLLAKYENRITEILVDNVYNIVEQQPTAEDFDIGFDLRIRAADGSIRWIHDFAHYDAKLDLFFITVTDITDKMVDATVHLSFEAFQARNEVLAYVSKYTTECVVVTDAETDEIIYMNPSTLKLVSLSQEGDWHGKTYIDVAFHTKENVPPEYYQPVTEEFTSREYYNKFHNIYVHTKKKSISIPNLARKMHLTILTDISAQKQLEYKIAVQTVLHNCVEFLFSAGITAKTADEAFYDILNQLKAYYQSDITFFYKFKNGTREVESIYEVFADGVQPSKHTFPITVPQHHMMLLQKLSNAQTHEYRSLLDSLNTNDTNSLKQLHAAHHVEDFACVSVPNNEGQIVACMGIANPRANGNDKELLELLSRFICMFIKYQQDQSIKEEALALENSSKKILADKCVKNFMSLTSVSESITDTLAALCAHYDADFAGILLKQEDGSYVPTYVAGSAIPDLTLLQDHGASILARCAKRFATNPDFASDMDFTDINDDRMKQMLHEKFGINNFIVAPIKDSNETINGLLILNNFKLQNRARLMVHIVADSISNYLARMWLYETTQLKPVPRLTNKATAQKRIAKLLELGKSGTLFILDIDNFKNLNETLGHHMGDQAIMDFGHILNDTFRSTDIIGRIGGDEFMVFSPGLTLDVLIAKKANLILEKCNQHYEKNGLSADISVSIGICTVGKKYKTFQPLYENADYALYVAKKSGKNQYHVYSSMEYFADTAAASEMQFYPNVIRTLKSAVENHGFVVHYQPIYHVPTGTYTQAEALVRIAKPDGTLIYPNDFIKVAETTGLVVDMTYQILEQVCRDFRHLLNTQPQTPLTAIAINVPYLQFVEPDMEQRFMDILNRYEISPSQIKLEITERIMVTDTELMLKKMASLRALGFAFELDDFGTDYSNLQMCITLPLEIIKLDRSLLLAAFDSDRSRRFFEHTMAGIHDTDGKIILEGVETQEQLDWATQCHCEYIQGYYFSKPLSFQNFTQFLLP